MYTVVFKFIHAIVSVCNEKQYWCSYGGCVDHAMKCDGKKDCLDGSDEEECKKQGESKCKLCIFITLQNIALLMSLYEVS